MLSAPQNLLVVEVTIESIMVTTAFRQGVADARAGRAPRFDGEHLPGFKLLAAPKSSITNQQWNYERGRQFGVAAPRDMAVMLAGTKRANPAAAEFYNANVSTPERR
jgi:hypothetical protein